MQDDTALLRSYADHRSEAAFAELVRRHLGLVYHAALRQTGGDPHRAQEIAQLVFTDLARKAADLARQPHLVAWLHTGVRYAASHLRRAEARRLAREQEAFAMSQTETAPEPAADWERLRPFIDEALESLGDRDRAAVLLRFFENRSYAEVAAALSVSDDAARVRVNRALEKLRATLARRGLVSTATALGLALAQPALAATPPGLAASITTASLSAAAAATAATAAGATTGGLAGGTLSTTTAATTTAVVVMSTAKIALTTAGVLALLSVGVVLYQRQPSSSDLLATHYPLLDTSLSPADLAAILHPARLSPADAAEALAAYLALPPLAPDAPQADYLVRAARLRALLTILPAEQHAQLLAATAARPGEPEDRLRRIAFTAWTELDAPAAAEWIAGLTPNEAIQPYQQRNYAAEAALAWARVDFDAAYRWATALPVRLAHHVGGQLLARLVATDSARALGLARSGDLAYFDAVRSPLFDAWLERDPAAAFTHLGAEMFAVPADRVNLSRDLARWVARDPQAALGWLDAHAYDESVQRAVQLAEIISHVGGRNPPPDFAAFATALVDRQKAGLGGGNLEHLFWTWMAGDPAAALRWIDTLPDAALRERTVRDVIADGGYPYATYGDLKPLLSLARRLPADERRAQAIDDFVSRWSQKDPAAALAWLEGAEGREFAGPEAARIVRVRSIAGQDPAAALADWGGIASADTRRDVAPALARSWALTEPAAAARWIFEQLPEGPLPDDHDAIGSLAPEEITAYHQRIQPYQSHAHTYAQVGAAWIAQDPAGFVTWAESLPSADRQRAALHLLSRMGAFRAMADTPEPAERLALIATLRNPARREPLMREHLQNWLLLDENSARRWASENGVETLLSPPAP